MKWKLLSRVWLFATPYSPWNSPGQNIEVGSPSLLQGIFSTQVSNPALLYCRWILCQLSHQRRSRVLERKWSCSVLSDSLWSHGMYLPASSVHGIFQAIVLEWVALPFSRGSSHSRDQTWVSCITGGFFTRWAIRETMLGVGDILRIRQTRILPRDLVVVV